ncbi:MAG: hypothetical protein SAJ37_07685, partial [Oscillatoria sp. PMC 1068.18]|nr:hypothetical protein [Oscillatoria sp. PMC 1076.18]MEC4988614.1 hypothetical protein [Oscillatoria sp. PMC 1068.18]
VSRLWREMLPWEALPPELVKFEAEPLEVCSPAEPGNQRENILVSRLWREMLPWEALPPELIEFEAEPQFAVPRRSQGTREPFLDSGEKCSLGRLCLAQTDSFGL